MGFVSKLKFFNLKWVLLIGIPLLSLGVAYYFISGLDKRYNSVAQLATGFTSDDAVKLSDTPTTPFDVNTNFNNTIESMKSVPVITLVSYRLVLHDLEIEKTFRNFDTKKGEGRIDDEEFIKAKELFHQKVDQFKTLNLFDPNDQLLFRILKGYGYDHQTLAKSLNIHRVGASDFIAVEFASEDPFLSAMTVNTVCQEFIRYNKTLKTDRSSESLTFLENVVNEKKTVLGEKTKALNDYRINNKVQNRDVDYKTKTALITEYEIKQSQTEDRLRSLKMEASLLDKNITAKRNSLGQITQEELQAINQHIIDLKRQITELTNADPEGNRARISRLRDALQIENSRVESVEETTKNAEDLKKMERDRSDVKMRIEIADNELVNFEQSLRKFKSEMSVTSTQSLNTSDFEREVDLASKELVSAEEKYNAAKNKSLIIGSSMRQILEGQPSYSPENSDATLWLGVVGGGSFLLTLLGIVLVNLIDPNIRVPGRLEKITGLRTMGPVNVLHSKDFNMREIFNDRSANKEYEMFSHFLRKIRYEIQSGQGKVFLITSSQTKAGKTFLIISISYALSLVSKKVLIIDTNFRHNSLTKALLPRGRGENKKLLRKALLFEEEEDELLLEEGRDGGVVQDEDDAVARMQKARTRTSIINKTRFINVDIIGNVGGRDSPSEIMAGRDFKEMISNLSQQYDYVLMEGPALNDYSDSKELIDFADKVIPVFRADSSITNMDKESLKYLKSINGRLMGTILNNVQTRNLSY